MPGLRSFEFEKLPPTMRHKIYRELLLKPREFDSQSEDSYLSRHDELGHRIQYLLVVIGEGDNQMHPEIMRTNGTVHDEAAAVLYGENWFPWSLWGPIPTHVALPGGERILCPRRYSRLITKMHLIVSTRGDGNDPTQSDAIFWTTRNLRSTFDFKILKVDFYNGLRYRYGGSARKGYYGERCLEPLKVCRAEKFLINAYASPHYAADLKVVIEGPQDARFRAYRKATEDDTESEYDEPKEDPDQPLYREMEDGDPMIWVAGKYGDEDERDEDMEGIGKNVKGRDWKGTQETATDSCRKSSGIGSFSNSAYEEKYRRSDSGTAKMVGLSERRAF